MRKEYDFAKMQGKPNLYAKLLKKRLTCASQKRKLTWAAT